MLLVLVVVAAFAGAVAWSSGPPPSAPKPIGQVPAAAVAAATHRRVALSNAHATAPRHPALVIRATRGACWLLVRRGGPGGPVLFEGLLEQGKTMRFVP